jgi:CTP-dependent riboflavin kinase
MNRTAASRSMSTKSVHEVRTGELISDSRVRHRYRLEDGLIVRMDVLEPPDQR